MRWVESQVEPGEMPALAGPRVEEPGDAALATGSPRWPPIVRDRIVADDDGQSRWNRINPALAPPRRTAKVGLSFDLAEQRASQYRTWSHAVRAGRRCRDQHRRVEGGMDEEVAAKPKPGVGVGDRCGQLAAQINAVLGRVDGSKGVAEAMAAADVAAGKRHQQLALVVADQEREAPVLPELQDQAGAAEWIGSSIEQVAQQQEVEVPFTRTSRRGVQAGEIAMHVARDPDALARPEARRPVGRLGLVPGPGQGACLRSPSCSTSVMPAAKPASQ